MDLDREESGLRLRQCALYCDAGSWNLDELDLSSTLYDHSHSPLLECTASPHGTYTQAQQTRKYEQIGITARGIFSYCKGVKNNQGKQCGIKTKGKKHPPVQVLVQMNTSRLVVM
jgi:hypothetical protein